MSEAYIGEIRMFAGTYAPMGWAMCDGQLLPIAQNDVLYSLLGTIYGGDGQTTFALPDLRGRLPLGVGTNPQTNSTYTRAQAGGTETVPLIAAQLPVHTHAATCQTNPGTSPTPANNYWATASAGVQYKAATAKAAMGASVTYPAGEGRPHDNMMPFLPLNFIIALEGYYPPQP